MTILHFSRLLPVFAILHSAGIHVQMSFFELFMTKMNEPERPSEASFRLNVR